MGINVEIEESLYKELSNYIEEKKKAEPYKNHTIKTFVNTAIKEKIDIEKILNNGQ